jgi:hypothetical protein
MAAKKKITKKTTGKTKKVKNLTQTHGKVEEFEPSTLEQIWGNDSLSTYSTMDEGEYEGQLNGMAKADMQAHATKVGLIPIDNTEVLRARLIKQFKSHLNSYRKPKVKPANNPKLTKELRDILGEGK